VPHLAIPNRRRKDNPRLRFLIQRGPAIWTPWPGAGSSAAPEPSIRLDWQRRRCAARLVFAVKQLPSQPSHRENPGKSDQERKCQTVKRGSEPVQHGIRCRLCPVSIRAGTAIPAIARCNGSPTIDGRLYDPSLTRGCGRITPKGLASSVDVDFSRLYARLSG
jgi:hypothetical protein